LTLSVCPRIVGLRLRGDYRDERLPELDAVLREARNAEIVVIDVRGVIAIGDVCLRRIAALHGFLQGIGSIRLAGAASLVRARVADCGLEGELQLLDGVGDGVALAWIDASDAA